MLILDNISMQTTTARHIRHTNPYNIWYVRARWRASITPRVELVESQKLSLTRPALGFDTMKYPTIPLNTTINGTVTNVQNGQHGPATTMGLPSFFSIRKNIDPTRRAQQQKWVLNVSVTTYGLQQSDSEEEVDIDLRRRRRCCCCCWRCDCCCRCCFDCCCHFFLERIKR